MEEQLQRPSKRRRVASTRNAQPLHRLDGLDRTAIKRVVGSTASDSGNAALIKLETESRILDLVFQQSDLPSMLAATLYAHQQCLTKSAKSDAVTFALPTEDVEIELLSDASVLMMVVLPGGQKIALKVPRDSVTRLQQGLQHLAG